MGDRANIVMHFDDGGQVWFYTHWAGSELAETLQAALKRGESHWDDPAYLARIIFCEMVRDDIDGLTGYGISTSEQDNEHPYIHVDTTTQTVQIGEKTKSYSAFCAVKFGG
jgi:hypothetical protein